MSHILNLFGNHWYTTLRLGVILLFCIFLYKVDGALSKTKNHRFLARSQSQLLNLRQSALFIKIDNYDPIISIFLVSFGW